MAHPWYVARVPLRVALAPLRPVDGLRNCTTGKSHARAKVAARCSPGASENDTHTAPASPEPARVEGRVGELARPEGGQKVRPVTVAGPVLGGGDERPGRPARRDDPLGALGLGHVVGVLGLEPHPDGPRLPDQRRAQALARVLVLGRGQSDTGRWGS